MPKLELYNEDCMVVMARYPDKYFELAIVEKNSCLLPLHTL